MSESKASPRKPPEAKYWLWPKLGRGARMACAAGLMLAGLAVQLWAASVLGLVIYFAGLMLLALRSVSAPKVRVSGQRTWERVTGGELKRLGALHQQIEAAKRKASTHSLGCGWGCVTTILYLAVVGVVTALFYLADPDRVDLPLQVA